MKKFMVSYFLPRELEENLDIVSQKPSQLLKAKANSEG